MKLTSVAATTLSVLSLLSYNAAALGQGGNLRANSLMEERFLGGAPQQTCKFELVGDGFCRTKDKHAPKEGDFEVVCDEDQPCNLKECKELCEKDKDCKGTEYQNIGKCELHFSTVDFVKANRKAVCHEKVCKQEKHAPKEGDIKIVCDKHEPCNLQECEELCKKDKDCKGIKFQNPGKCELDFSTVPIIAKPIQEKPEPKLIPVPIAKPIQEKPEPKPFVPLLKSRGELCVFNLVGNGFCRTKDKDAPKEGDFKIVCDKDEPCNLKKCQELCDLDKDCKGTEYQNIGKCELHFSTVDFVKENDKAVCHQIQCAD